MVGILLFFFFSFGRFGIVIVLEKQQLTLRQV